MLELSTSYYLTRENTSPLFLGKLTDTSFIWSIEPLDARQLTSLDHGSDRRRWCGAQVYRR